MNYSKNYTPGLFFKRALCYAVYYTASAFMGKITVMILSPFMQYFINDYNSLIFDLVWYALNLTVIYAVMIYFISRDGFSDTGNHRYSAVKNFSAIFCAAVLFSGILLFFYFFPQFEKYAYIISFYFSYTPVWHFISRFAVYDAFPFFFIYTGAVLLSCAAAASAGYYIGRKKWIATQKKKIKRIKAESEAKEQEEKINRIYRR